MRAKILYVEDNPLNIRLIKKMLKLMEVDMIEADNGQQGLALANSSEPDLILLDMHLPDIDGLELAARIKDSQKLAHIPLVALTADTGNAEACRAAGCDGYLNKPVSSAYLLRTVMQFLKSADTEPEMVR
ncbi:MAG: response regulator [Anaerolineae bacterium]